MGQGASRASIEEVFNDLPESEKYFGFENFGNTCYCNSVLQALYFCPSFRNNVLEYKGRGDISGSSQSVGKTETVLSCLSELFQSVRAPRVFVVVCWYIRLMVYILC
jgi:ubiquitin carboxyl-terminal hydrolase 12/46